MRENDCIRAFAALLDRVSPHTNLPPTFVTLSKLESTRRGLSGRVGAWLDKDGPVWLYGFLAYMLVELRRSVTQIDPHAACSSAFCQDIQ